MNIQRSKLSPVHLPDNLPFADLILQRANQHGEIIALIDAQTNETMSYTNLADNIRRFASVMHSAGLKKGDVVAIFSRNHILYPITFIGLAYLGVIPAVINPNYTAGELRDMLEEVEASHIFTMSSLVEVVRAAVQGYDQLQEIFLFDNSPSVRSVRGLMTKGRTDFVSPVSINPKEDVLVMPFSSGTTGRSKAVLLTHYNVVANVYQGMHPGIRLSTSPTSHDTFICFLPFYHIYALSVIQALGFTAGHTLVIIEKFQLEFYLQCIEKYKATVLHVVPPVALQLGKKPIARQYDLSSVEMFYCGAAPLGPEVEKELLRETGIPIFRQGYGLTETGPNTHVAPVNGWKHGSCGILVPNTECKIVDLVSGENLGPDKDGELHIRGPQVMKGYLHKPSATREAIDRDGWFHTGDIGHYDKDGYFYVVDRLKELIKWKALQVAPADVEFVILKHPAVADVAVVGVPHSKDGEVPKAFVVRKPGVEVSAESIIQFVADNAAPHKKIQGGVEFLTHIPKSPSGKILRRLLRKDQKNIDSNLKSKL